MKWYVLSILAALLLAAHFLLVKKATTMGVSVVLVTFFAWAVSASLLLGYLLMSKQSIQLGSWTAFAVVALASVTLLFGALFLNKGLTIAPNPGYATAIGSMQVMLVILFSAYFFAAELSLAKFVGATLVIAGVVLLGI